MKIKYTIIGIICGILVTGITYGEVGWHWVEIIPIPLGLIIGSGIDNLENKIW